MCAQVLVSVQVERKLEVKEGLVISDSDMKSTHGEDSVILRNFLDFCYTIYLLLHEIFTCIP